MFQVALFHSVVLSATRRITSADLRAVAGRAGAECRATVLSTGNLILRDPGDPAALEQRLEAATADLLGKSIAVFVRSAADFHALVAANPFAQETATNPARVAVRVLRAPASPASLARITAKLRDGERFLAQPRALWLCTADAGSYSPLLTAVAAPWVGPGTLRSASALGKIAAVLPR